MVIITLFVVCFYVIMKITKLAKKDLYTCFEMVQRNFTRALKRY